MLREFGAFFTKQVAASIFALVILLGLVLAPYVPLPRYDFLLLICIAMQGYLVWSRLESKRDLALICIFHALGLGLALYKVNSGSWSYPEDSFSKFLGVPFYSGFMYASVASYILQAWRWFDLEFCDMPTPRRTWLSVGLIYSHFFMSRVWADWRWLVTLVLGIVFGRASVRFTCADRRFRMPLLLSFALIGLFVWLGKPLHLLGGMGLSAPGGGMGTGSRGEDYELVAHGRGGIRLRLALEVGGTPGETVGIGGGVLKGLNSRVNSNRDGRDRTYHFQ